MNRSPFRITSIAMAAGLALGIASAAMLGAAGAGGGDYHVTQSSDGKSVYVWSIGGDGSVEFVSSARTSKEAHDDKSKGNKEEGDDDAKDDSKGKPDDAGEKGKGKDKDSEKEKGGKGKN